MTIDARKTVVMAFIIATIVSTTIVAYTARAYIGLYEATRSFNVTVQKFTVDVFNDTYALIETVLIMQNPSEYTFEVIYVQERLRLNVTGEWQHILVDGAYFWQNPKLMPPFSNVTTTFKTSVPESRIWHITEQTERTWLVWISVYMKGPFVNEMLLSFYEVTHER